MFTLKQIGEKAWEKKRRVYVSFMDLKKAYDRVDREAPCQMPRMYDVGGKLLSGIKSIYVNSLACVRVKWGMRKGRIMSPWLFSVYKWRSDEGSKNGVGEDGSEIYRERERLEIT